MDRQNGNSAEPRGTGYGHVFPTTKEMARLPEADRKFGALLAAESGHAVKPTAPPKPQNPGLCLSETAIDLGISEFKAQIGIEIGGLLDGRLLIQGASGSGKSWTLRRLIEQTHGRIQQIIIDAEGEFGSIADHFDHLRLSAAKLDIAALAAAGERIRAHRVSAILDLSDIEREAQMIALTAFLKSLINAPSEAWTPTLVFVDEVHLFAPYGVTSIAQPSVRKASIEAVTDLMSRGRKRGLAGVLATQRLARLAKSVTSEAINTLVGINTLDLDIRRAAETIGWDARKAFDRLPELKPGDFVASGPAFTQSPSVLRVGPVMTEHKGARPEHSPPPSHNAASAAELIGLEELEAATAQDEEIRSEESLPAQTRAIRNFMREPECALALQIVDALHPLAPDGALKTDLQTFFDAGADNLTTALALLDQYGVLDFKEEGDDQAIALSKGFML